MSVAPRAACSRVRGSDQVGADPIAAGPADPGGQGEDFGKSSPLGFLILVLFFVAVALLVRSMTKHLKRLPESFDKPADEPAEGAEPPAKPAAG